MNTNAGQERRVPAVAIVMVLFAISVYCQHWVAGFVPTVAGLAQIHPTFIFLEIPVQLPFTIDLILAPALFLVLYPLVILFFPSGPGLPWWYQTSQRLKAALGGLAAVLISLLTGGGIYHFVQGYLPARVKTGIDTLGMNADIHLAGYDAVPLRGSMVLGICFLIGMAIFIKKVSRRPALRLTREQRMTPYERMLREQKQPQPKFTYQPKPVTPISSHQPCDAQPVFTLKPLAVGYMPIG